jgi:hypothetical protein
MIEIRRVADDDPLDFEVVVREGKGETRHHVTISREMCERLTAGKHTPERCLEAAFRFLLDREPKESISWTLRRHGDLALLPRIRARAAALPLAVLMESCGDQPLPAAHSRPSIQERQQHRKARGKK